MVSYAGPSYHGTGSVVGRIRRTDGKRSRKREGERREKSGRTGAADDRMTSVYPPAKPLPEFIIICSTTGAVCGLRPRGAHPLWYQIIPRRNKKVHSHTRALGVTGNIHRRTWPRNLRDTTGHGRRGKKKTKTSESQFRLRFSSFPRWTKGDFISSTTRRDPSVKVALFRAAW